MQQFSARTDLALEAHESRVRSGSTSDGVSLERLGIRGCTATKLSVLDHIGAGSIGKPVGSYYTLELEKYINRRHESFSDCAHAVADIVRGLIPEKASRFLVACLGNRDITPDAVGPCVADGLIVTRHVKASMPREFAAFSEVAVIRTGVLGTTGIESADSIRSACELVRPDCVIVVDALACSELPRLCRSIQLTDTGISPGSGVGNDRAAVSFEQLGVPVIAAGIPTVSDASVFTGDDSAVGLFVTPRNIDELVKSCSKVLAYGIDLALHPGLTVADVDMLVE